MGFERVFFALSFACVALPACNRELAARRRLEGDGYVDIVLVKSGKNFTFTAKNASGQHCFGDVEVSRGSWEETSSCADVCTATESAKCFDLALSLVTTDPAKSTAYYVIGCDAGVALACTNAGVAYGKGTGVPVDEAKSFAYDKRACDGGEMQGCVNLAIDYDGGEGAPMDRANAFRIADLACTKNNMTGCAMSGRAMVEGRGIPSDAVSGADRLDRACKADIALACSNFGVYLIEGTHGLNRDLTRGQALLETACTKSSAIACANLGLYFMNKKLVNDTALSMVDYLKKGCDGGEGLGCNTLGYVTERGLGGLTADETAAVALYRKACDLGDALGCRNVGNMIQHGRGAPRDLAKAADAFDDGCKRGDTESCTKRKAIKL